MRQRFPQTVLHVFADGVCEALASLSRFVYAVAVRDLSHGRNFVGFQFAEALDIFKDGVQIAQHASALFLGQLEVRQIGYIGNVFVSNFHTRAKSTSKFSSRSFQLRLHHEFNSLHRSRGILIDQRHVTRRQVREFAPPSRVGNLDSQNTVRKTQRPGPLGDSTATGDRPRQQGALGRRRAMKSFSNDVFQAGGSTVQAMTPESRTRSEQRSENVQNPILRG